jgi:hypothetical protein
MGDGDTDRQLEAEGILRKVLSDFEQLDRTIDKAISLLKERKGSAAKEIDALGRAREAARKGAALAKTKVDPE